MTQLLFVLEPIERPLTSLLEWLHSTIGLPWGWSIVALTLLVRMAIVPLTVRQIHSMQNLQRFAPQMKEIQQKYKPKPGQNAKEKQELKRRQQEELMAFYRENKINPAASCLPMLLQIPIFIALFYVLRDFERDIYPKYPGSDLGWFDVVPNIADPAKDHWSGALLLVIYVASQFASTYFMATTLQGAQRYVMYALPFLFVPFIINFPAGLVLYWMTSNLWTVGQGLVTRQLTPKPEAPQKRSSRTPPKEEAGSADGAARDAAAAPAAAPPQPRRVKRKKKKARR